MKVVLQDKLSRLYLNEDGDWTADPTDAQDFGASLKAMEFVHVHKLTHAHVVLKFSETRYDIVLQTHLQKPSTQSPRPAL